MQQLLDKLPFWLQSIDDIFKQFDLWKIGSKNSADRRIFIDNGGSILFVAHVDTVLLPKFTKQTKKRLYATGLDDRLGCLLAYELGMELKADILLTDDEEKCKSTAFFHNCKDYNWIVEFDRAKDDIVVYDKSSIEFLQKLSDYWKIGIGSYSDICDLDTDVCCFNLGIGIKNGHYKSCSVDIKMFEKQVRKFKTFYEKYRGVKFIADETRERCSYRYDDRPTYSDSDCELCGSPEMVEYVHGMLLCGACFFAAMDDYMGYADEDKIEDKEKECELMENWK